MDVILLSFNKNDILNDVKRQERCNQIIIYMVKVIYKACRQRISYDVVENCLLITR